MLITHVVSVYFVHLLTSFLPPPASLFPFKN